MFNRVSAEKLQPRLDADFYKKEFIANDDLLKASGAVRLSSLIDVAKSSYGVLPKSEEYVASGVPLIRGGDLSFGKINPPEVHAPTSYAGGKGIAEEGDILILIKGACIDGPEGVARVSENEKGYIFNGSCYRLAFKNRDVDGYFFVAYSQARQFLMQKKRQVANTGISYNDEESILGYLLPNLQAITKKYIGDKVRQAERLRAWAKVQDGKLAEFESKIPLQKPAADERKYSKAELNYLTDNRLDAKFYERKHLALEAEFNEQFRNLGAITSGFKYGASVTADYVSQDHGITFIRGNAISKNNINTADIVYLHGRFLDDVSSCRVKTGEVLITRSGTVGVSCDVFDEFNGAAYGSFVIKCQPRTEQVSSAYLAWFLNSWVGQQQFRRWENGAVQLNINIEELSSIMVWLAPSEVQNQIAELIEAKRKSDKYSRNLTIAAKLLIEGQLTEAELIAAEQALQAGNDQLDRRILNRLKTDGVDGQGAALFGDLDELYQLLTQAEGD